MKFGLARVEDAVSNYAACFQMFAIHQTLNLTCFWSSFARDPNWSLSRISDTNFLERTAWGEFSMGYRNRET